MHLLVRDIVNGVMSGESVPKDLQYYLYVSHNKNRFSLHIKYKRSVKFVVRKVNVLLIAIIDC